MKTIPLSQVVQINPRLPGGLEDSREISFVPMASVSEDGGITFQETRNFGEVKKGFTYFQRGDVLLAKITPCFENGKSALADNLEHSIGFGSTEFHVLRTIPGKFDSRFLYHLVRSNQLLFLGQRSMKGAAGHKRVPAEFLENFEVPEWPLDDQIRIAYLLGKVEGLIAQRKQHLQQLDDLLKSVFLEMFGFRDGTYTRWRTERLALSCDVVSGITKGKKYATEELIKVPYMRVANVQDGHFVLDEVKTIAVTQKEIDQYRLQRGDLLLTEGGDPDKLGRGSVWENQVPNCIHQNHIFRVRINGQEELNSYYLSALVGSRYGKSYFLKSAKQTTGIASINSTQLKNFPTVIPSVALQNQFTAIVEKVEGIKSRYQASRTDLEALYCALSQQAFKGELDLSRVPMPGIQLEEEKTVAAEPLRAPAEQGMAIHLPDTDNLLAALESAEAREGVIAQWLEAYRGQLGNTPFSVQQFMAAAQARLAELHPDNDFELGGNDYEHIKARVFKALDAGTLTQAFDDAGNRIELKAVQA